MTIYSINYDLKKPGHDYDGLYEAIKGCGAWWHYLESTWLVDTALTADGIWERVKSHVDGNDRMLIVVVSNPKSGWLPTAAWDWINARLRVAA
ncbi:hypothetical protein I3J27_17480 [Bradyrhizobium xenonodulans]|uniref:SinR n=1 Tax=Bradyrhizobium xenonodulans TaxID=2736875 RepID=A0ABY7MX89_9BRAD|nr:hypothetical protein [Bradyrhizobium xenonodulans]WBL82128.1 hypothetical protein I3J27_17480 [Bradyrhizobium xenonodulans]